MIAEYFAVDNATLQQLQALDDNALLDAVLATLEDPDTPRVDLGKLWDVLHFTLTQQSARAPIAGHPLSEAIVGSDTFSGNEDADFIGFIDWSLLAEIVEALEQVNIKKLTDNLPLKALRQADIFPPNIWQDKKSQLAKELINSFDELKAFYEATLDSGDNIIVSIL